ncbi:MAG: hypothetical protein Q9213_001639 [Squamulea squamosa]
MDMCRFSSLHDHEYRKVVAALRDIAGRTTGILMDPAHLRTNLVPDKNQRKSFVDALWFPAVDARHLTIKAAHAKTCRWLLRRPEYNHWLDFEKTPIHHGILWIKGKPGSGKSTLMKFLVASARKTEKGIISFFFNARGEGLEKSTLGMYRSLLFQFFKAIPDTQVVLDCLGWTSLEDGDSHVWEISDLQNLFKMSVQKLEQRRLICFIDALDECEEYQIRDLIAFLEELGDLATLSQIHFHTCLSSRHYPHVSIKNGIQLILEGQEGHAEDMAKYLKSELKVGGGSHFEAIREEILYRASGIFLWVALVVQILNREYDHGRVHALWKRLREIPDGLDKLFEDILMRDQDHKDELVLCLQWILYATRPLKREELYFAILSGTDDEAPAAFSTNTTTARDMERFILSCSKGLAEITKSKQQTVQFIHESVRDFLLGKNGSSKLRSELEPGQSHENLKKCCYAYIKIDVSDYLSTGIELPVANSTDAKNLRGMISEKYPFLEYAVRNVLSHADGAGSHDIFQEAFMEEFAFGDWIRLNNLFEKYQIRRYTFDTKLSYIFAKLNLRTLLRTQLMQELKSVTPAKYLQTEAYTAPLYAALADAKVSEDTIRIFLLPISDLLNVDGGFNDACSDFDSSYQQTAVEEITRNRPEINPRKGQTLLVWAASNGQEAVIKLLLEKTTVDPNSRDKSGRTPLSWAVGHGHEAVVKLLLEGKITVDPDSRDKNGRTPLSWAAEHGHEAVVKLLLEEKVTVDPDSRDKNGQTPLSRAAEHGHEAVVKLLLEENVTVDPDSRDKSGGTPLSWAALNGHEAVVKLLLGNENIDPNSRDNNGRTPLSWAALKGREAVVKLLLGTENVDPDSIHNDGRTPLSWAAEYGHEAVVKLLLGTKKLDPDSRDNDGRTPLSWAACNGYEAVVKLLLGDENVDPDSIDNGGRTPLSWAALNGREAIVKLLLGNENVDPDSVDNDGRTPLYWAKISKSEAVVKLLLAKSHPSQ